MTRTSALRTQASGTESCGNAGAVESVESQKQAYPSSHEPLGNHAKSRRDSHIPTAPATRADGKVENQKQVSHFPTATSSLSLKNENPERGAGFAHRPATAASRRLEPELIVVDPEK
jgi:hypothetical protein